MCGGAVNEGGAGAAVSGGGHGYEQLAPRWIGLHERTERHEGAVYRWVKDSPVMMVVGLTMVAFELPRENAHSHLSLPLHPLSELELLAVREIHNNLLRHLRVPLLLVVLFELAEGLVEAHGVVRRAAVRAAVVVLQVMAMSRHVLQAGPSGEAQAPKEGKEEEEEDLSSNHYSELASVLVI